MQAIVTGMIATYPVGGVAWDYGQYALGLEQLGFEVYYLEDTGWQTYDPRKGVYSEDCSYGVHFLNESLARLSPALGDHWHFRAMDGTTYGIEADRFNEIIAEADIFLNVSGGTLLRDEYMVNRRKLLIDSDPGWNHFVNFPKWDKNPGWYGTHGWRAHDHFFTYAERIGQPDCVLPTFGITWHPTRPLVVLDQWKPKPPGAKWTTVMTWTENTREPMEYDGVVYGTKETEFAAMTELPSHTPVPLELAVGGFRPPRDHLRALGWSVIEAESISRTADDYRSYIQKSRGEFSIAKNVYVATRSGWFSCRSICYLASGRPVVVQDTGFSEFIPTGEGLFAFSTLEAAKQGIEAVEHDYMRHQQGALEIAREYFGSDRVLAHLLREIEL
ncbi:glycosyltransferase [Candidatus Poribacteria bacterium]